MIRPTLALLLAGLAIGGSLPRTASAAERPNVVLILTDDQGYGDLSCHGNAVLKTPHLDRLHGESVRLTDYHVDPTCSPTRAALYTGRYSTKTGVWHTIQGRSMMAPEEVTLAERLRDAGYRTGMIGKWHLGDNAPLRARDQGYDFAYTHGGGGVGQAPDYWGNDYFGDTYTWFSRSESNPEGTEELRSTEKYCTDEWFDAAEDFVDRNDPAKTGRPFFLTLATNAPHGPYRVPEEWSQPYRDAGVKGDQANFYGMIANIDARLGDFRARLDELGLTENTIFVFTTDNGTAAGHQNGGFNAGMRAAKGSEYDGGHRVPFFLHWPAGGFAEARDVDRLTAHVDVLPTVLSLCGVPVAGGEALDGRDLTPLLRDAEEANWPDRTLTVHSQRIEVPEKWRKSAVMTDRWRLVNRDELYDIEADPGQKSDVAADHPEIVEELRQAYEQWWASLEPAFDDPFAEDLVRIDLGPGPVELCAHDWHEPDNRPVPWSQAAIRKDPVSTGWWAVEAPQAGRYRFTLRDRPAAAEEDGAWQGSVSVSVEAKTSQSRGARTGSFSSPPVIILTLPEGPAKLSATFTEGDVTRGAYYVTVEAVEPLLTPDLSDVLPDD
ncbi:arylsulfatase [Alienimonas californiensis]|uniref:Arylsulfatase n=1 Tax=Alienimonas californiensis TaxID=2527989 RepID=A0A517PD74_9PLAN|nr:arylsulfatase [Alienimonas californiensis]QDT17328.1 Arylsulfatase precursor [Alienimonas californiensis]